MRRFPVRTLLLMTLALLAFARLYFVTHPARTPESVGGTPRGVTPPVQAIPPSVAPACPALEKALERVLREPGDASVLGTAREQLDACPALPVRVCELGPALDARFPSNADMAPPRELLERLCQRCPEGANPCARAVIRSVMNLPLTGQLPSEVPLWYLEHVGPGSKEACAEVVRSLLVPGLTGQQAVAAEQKRWMEQLVPVCAGAGQVSSPVLRALVAQGDVPALTSLVQTTMPVSGETVLKPDQMKGPPDAARAFDGDASTTVSLPVEDQTPAGLKNGALSAVFEPPLQALTALQVRARGPGTLHAVVRVEGGIGLQDAATGANFIRPRVCRFKGTGQWEPCALPVALLNVEAISVHPDKGPLTLSDVEIRGTR
ncbi:MAG: hypothetical protein ABW123_25715 [Cystobacter sp.]